MPYPADIYTIPAGHKPASDSPAILEFTRMQAKAQSALGSCIWASRAHNKMTFPTNFYCALMSNPSDEMYKAFKHTLMHEIAWPTPLRFGGFGHGSLEIGSSPIRPFTSEKHELGLHFFFDANLGAPRSQDTIHDTAISSGTEPSDPPAMARSVTGGWIMLAGGPLLALSQRQHLVAPCSHSAEVTAGGTILHRVIPLRGTLQECSIPQMHPTPGYTDSQSTIFCANTAAAAKKSVWLNRRSAVLRSAVDMKAIVLDKIGDPDNCANYNTKPVRKESMEHYFSYTHPPHPSNKS